MKIRNLHRGRWRLGSTVLDSLRPKLEPVSLDRFRSISLSFLISIIWLVTGSMISSNPIPKANIDAASDRASITLMSASFQWVLLDENEVHGSCLSETDCCAGIICYGLEYTPGVTGEVTTYTTGFFVDCLSGMTPVVSNGSCVMTDNSFAIDECSATDSLLFNASAYDGSLAITSGVPVILHQVCFSLQPGESIIVSEDVITDLSLSIDLDGGGHIDEFPDYTPTTISRPLPVWPVDGADVVACTGDAVLPIPPDIFDDCGNTIPAILLDIEDTPDPITCEGTREYSFEYLACSGLTHTWKFLYSISYESFSVPADGISTVACVDAADGNLIDPPLVFDHCGKTVVPAGPSPPVYDPPIISCEGTVTFTWTYTDCANNINTWDHVFMVEPLAPAEQGGPVPTDSTISCGLDANPPTLLPVVLDACGTTISAPSPDMGGTYVGGCEGTITYTYVYSNCPGEEFVWVYTYTVECSPIEISVFLEGPYFEAGDSLLPDLNVNHVLPGQDKLLSPNLSVQLSAPFTPFGQPYSVPPWNYNGNPGTDFGDPTAPGAPGGVTPYPEDVVDWILVTVRENGLLPADNIWTCAGWVHTDGHISFPELCAGLVVDVANDYYVLVQHRNHLGVLSPVPVDELCGGATIVWDFTLQNSYEPIFRNGQKEIVPGIWAMYHSNGEQLSSITAIASQDRTIWRIHQNALGYSPGDYNLNVITNSFDETLWKFNQNASSGVIFY